MSISAVSASDEEWPSLTVHAQPLSCLKDYCGGSSITGPFAHFYFTWMQKKNPIPSSVLSSPLSEGIEAFVKETRKLSHCELKLQLISEINKPVYRRQQADPAVPGVTRFPRWNTSLDVKSLQSAQTCRMNRRKKNCTVGIDLISVLITSKFQMQSCTSCPMLTDVWPGFFPLFCIKIDHSWAGGKNRISNESLTFLHIFRLWQYECFP